MGNKNKVGEGNNSGETLNMRYELDKKRKMRIQVNNQQKEAYNHLLGFLEKRGKPILR